MAKLIGKVGGVDPADLSVLRASKYRTTDDLWSALGKDPEFINNAGLKDAAAQIRLANALAKEATRQARSITSNPFRRHIPDVVIVGLLVLIVIPLIVRNRDLVLTTKAWLPAYHIIDDSDIQIVNSRGANKENSTGTTAETNNANNRTGANSTMIVLQPAVGRYAKEQLPAGYRIDPTRLSGGVRLSKQLAGMLVFSLKLQASPILNNVTPPAQLGVYFASSSKNDASSQVQRIHVVYVLDLQKLPDGIMAVIAAPESETRELLSLSTQGQFNAVSWYQ
jgi:hypothetical protein